MNSTTVQILTILHEFGPQPGVALIKRLHVAAKPSLESAIRMHWVEESSVGSMSLTPWGKEALQRHYQRVKKQRALVAEQRARQKLAQVNEFLALQYAQFHEIHNKEMNQPCQLAQSVEE